MVTRWSILIALMVCAVAGCGRGGSSPVQRKYWPLRDVRKMPAEITIASGTTFLCGGVPCRLLGVKDSSNPDIRQQAETFTRLWFKEIGNYIGIYNDSNPLIAPDGTAVVWVRGYDTYLSCLSEELVRAGLVEVDDECCEGYTFTEPTMGGEAIHDWRGTLHRAKEGHARGEKPEVLFDWPPK